MKGGSLEDVFFDDCPICLKLKEDMKNGKLQSVAFDEPMFDESMLDHRDFAYKTKLPRPLRLDRKKRRNLQRQWKLQRIARAKQQGKKVG